MAVSIDIALSEAELAARRPARETQAASVGGFLEHGVVVLRGAFRRELAQRLGEAFLAEYAAGGEAELARRGMRVGQERYMLSVTVKPPFSDYELLAAPLVSPLLRLLLGKGYVLGSFGCVCALPGAPAQHVHVDHPPLFESEPVHLGLPPYAVTAIIPLVDTDGGAGGTAVWEGSHRRAGTYELAQRLRGERSMEGASWPELRQGDCLLMDYRLLHGGGANGAERPRPILYLVFNRPWFRDFVNFPNQAPVTIDTAAYDDLPGPQRELFRLCRPPGSRRLEW